MSTTDVTAKGQIKKIEAPNSTNNKKPQTRDAKKELRDVKNKMKFHSTKMDLNLKILRDEMSSLADTGNSLSRQMASMYRTLKQVKDEEGQQREDEDTYTEDQDSEPEVDTTSAHRSFEALDTEDDVNKMSDLDSESCSFAGRQNRKAIKESGLAKSPKRLQVCDNINEIDDDKTPQPKEGYHFTYPESDQASDPHITPMSLTLTSTDNGENNNHHDHHEHHHHRGHDRDNHNDSSDSESDDESLPDTSSDECSRCLCCSSLASYQNIPWRIQRRDSATTTEASDSSEYCSDSDEEEGHRRVPLYAKFSPFFFQECASGEEGDEETDECEKMDEDADSLPEQTRMSPLGRESSPARSPASEDNNPTKSKTADRPVAIVKDDKDLGKPPYQLTEIQPTEEEPEEEEVDEQSSASVIEKIQRMQTKIADEKKNVDKQRKTTKQPESKSKYLSPNQHNAPPVSAKMADSKSKTKVAGPEVKEKQRHVSKSHMFVVAPSQSGEHKGKKKMVLTTGEESMFEIPASCIDKEGKVTLRPDPKLAPEAFRSGKTITFQVKHTPDGVVATDGTMMLTTTPRTTRTILRVRGSQPSTPTSPMDTKSTVEVTPEGVINIRKRRTIPVKINPVQAIPVVRRAQDDTHSCSHCNHHRQPIPSSHQEAIPRYITRKVTTHQTTVTPIYGNSTGQPIVINQQGILSQPQQYVINTQGGIIPQAQQQSIIINPHGGIQQRQIIVGPQPIRTGPIQSISVTPSPSSVRHGSPLIYRTNSSDPVQSFQTHPGQMQQPMIRLGGPSQIMSVRVANSDGFAIPMQATQPGQMHFVINQ